jgi:hypothetical protein
MRRLAFALAALFALASSAPGEAQTLPVPPALPGAPGVAPAGRETATLRLDAIFAGEAKPIQSGLVWRIYQDRTDGVQPPLVKKEASPAPILSLPAGSYIVHAAYGFASASRRVEVRPGNNAEQLTISAGALRLGGVIGDQPIPKNRLSYSIFVPIGSNSEGRLVAANVKAGELIVLPEGTYHVASTYGESNAIMRADLKVEQGKVTDATLNHRAATLILKLVSAEGGEAFAGTAFSVLTPGGDVIREAIGAFPSVTLAEGDYVLIARHEGQVYQREFKVESGIDRDVEVLAKR